VKKLILLSGIVLLGQFMAGDLQAKDAQSVQDTYLGIETNDWEYQFKNDWFYSKREPRFTLQEGKKYLITYKNVTVMLPNEEGASKTKVKEIVEVKKLN